MYGGDKKILILCHNIHGWHTRILPGASDRISPQGENQEEEFENHNLYCLSVKKLINVSMTLLGTLKSG